MFTLTTIAGAQFYQSNIQQYKVKLSTGAGKLIDAGNAVPADSINKMFKKEGYAPVSVNYKPANTTPLSPGKIYELVAQSTVIVSPAGRCKEKNERGQPCTQIHTFPATGYIIDAAGIIVTNYHVVSSYVYKGNTTARDVLAVMLKDGTLFPVKAVLAADRANDLAVIKIDPGEKPLVPLAIAEKDAEIGDPVFMVSHPKQYFYAFTSGMVTDKFSELNINKYRNIMAISADFAAGSSGGAIIDQFGNVIGTVTYTKTLQHSDNDAKTQMVLKATIPSSCLLSLLKEGNK